MNFRLAYAAFAVLVGAAVPVSAEVVRNDPSGFVTRDVAVVDATPKEVWLALISPAKWWSPAHTWSGDAANLSLTPRAGGCFCERIPELADPDRATLEGSVEHMRVIQAYPEEALRMRGALGPLQSEPVSGVLTITLSKAEQGTRIVWEYVVGGYMRYDLAQIAPAVGAVMTQQLNGLSTLLGIAAASGSEAGPDSSSGSANAQVNSPASVEAEIDAMADN